MLYWTIPPAATLPTPPPPSSPQCPRTWPEQPQRPSIEAQEHQLRLLQPWVTGNDLQNVRSHLGTPEVGGNGTSCEPQVDVDLSGVWLNLPQACATCPRA